ncbi:MAG: DUF885 domain-containing protein [Planctomycetota bacterium]|jgi:uncharacterized protein (DUF885 family)
MRQTTMTCVLALALTARGAAAATETERLHDLFASYTTWQDEQYPAGAMARGDYTHADRLADVSLAAIDRRHEQMKRYLLQLRSVDPAELSAADRLNWDLFELKLLRAIEGHPYRMFLSPVGGRHGPHTRIPQMGERVRFRSYADYDNYLKRLAQVPRLIGQYLELLQAGLAEGRTPPQVTLAGLPGQFDAILAEGGGLEALGAPLDEMPAFFTDRQREGLRRRYEEEALPAVRGAMRQLRDFVVETYMPGCRQTIAASDLPDGKAYYAYQLRIMTTTDMTATEIHELGLREVARIRQEMLQVIRSSDFMHRYRAAGEDQEQRLFKAFLDYLRTDPRFYHTSEAALLAGYRDICKQVDAWLPRFFGTLPRLPYGVRAIPPYMAPTQTTAYYQSGDLRNAQPGWFCANTYALDQRPKYEMIPLTLHEAVPGHHLQGALARELEDLPEFRRGWGFNAFGEGWALYAERLGLEMGLYEDPYDDFGRLLYEMWRACRLVVDTGMHAFGWPRDEAIEFMVANTALSQLNIANEVDRYISWPGQACAYKIGEIRIRELRRRAESRLGERFDLRTFHDVVLGAGSVPLTVLEKRVNYWINSQMIRAYD